MSIKMGDFIKFKSADEILNNNCVKDVSVEGNIKFCDGNIIYKDMFWYFGKSFVSDITIRDSFYIKGCKHGFSSKWVDTINDKKNIDNEFYPKEDLKFLKKEKDIRNKIKQFMKRYNKENPIYEISSTDRGYILINNGAEGTFISSEYRFSTEGLAQECLNSIGEDNWKKYILGIKET